MEFTGKRGIVVIQWAFKTWSKYKCVRELEVCCVRMVRCRSSNLTLTMKSTSKQHLNQFICKCSEWFFEYEHPAPRFIIIINSNLPHETFDQFVNMISADRELSCLSCDGFSPETSWLIYNFLQIQNILDWKPQTGNESSSLFRAQTILDPEITPSLFFQMSDAE